MYNNAMGLIGLLIAVGIMILGTVYLFFGNSTTSLTVTNDALPRPIVQELENGQSAIQSARDMKNLVEQQAIDTIQQSTENVKQTIDNEEQTEENLDIVNRLMGSGFATVNSERTIDTIVLHSSYDLLGKDPYAVAGLVKEYEQYGVSAHYLIDRNGKVYRLVEDKNIAYHAGVSTMPDGRKNANDFSIGIEIMNKETTQYTKAQYVAVNNLIAYLKKQHPIKFVVGHSDIAPGRKTDPWNFDWKKLK